MNSLEEAGISGSRVEELVLKNLYYRGETSGRDLSKTIGSECASRSFRTFGLSPCSSRVAWPCSVIPEHVGIPGGYAHCTVPVTPRTPFVA